MREALLQFANVPFGELKGEELRKEASKWAEELQALGPAGSKQRADDAEPMELGA